MENVLRPVESIPSYNVCVDLFWRWEFACVSRTDQVCFIIQLVSVIYLPAPANHSTVVFPSALSYIVSCGLPVVFTNLVNPADGRRTSSAQSFVWSFMLTSLIWLPCSRSDVCKANSDTPICY